jgi:cytochrome c oxidase subunit 4
MADHAHHDVQVDHGHDVPHVHHEEHPTWTIYWKVALVLTIITVAEVSAYYIPTWEESWIYVPSMLTMSAAKFAIVVMYYMHLKYDHRLFRSLFTGPLIVAGLTLIALLFLFGQLTARLGLLS